MNAYGFLGLLTLIVFGRGYIALNEQFLVAICFIAFLATIIFYSGDDIQDYFEVKQRELTADHIDFVKKTKSITNRLTQVLENKKLITFHLMSINNIYQKLFQNIIVLTERKIFINYTNTFYNELQNINMIEISAFTSLQNILTQLYLQVSLDSNKMIRRLKCINS